MPSLFFAHMPISVPGMSVHPHSFSLSPIQDSTTSQDFRGHNLGEINCMRTNQKRGLNTFKKYN